MADDIPVAQFDRGWLMLPNTPAAFDVVLDLMDTLADQMYSPCRRWRKILRLLRRKQ